MFWYIVVFCVFRPAETLAQQQQHQQPQQQQLRRPVNLSVLTLPQSVRAQ